MRRVGNRLQLAVKRWIREGKKLEAFRARQRWARKFSEYECVGGPLDGLLRKCEPTSVVPLPGGVYVRESSDCRLHFRLRAPISSDWSGQ